MSLFPAYSTGEAKPKDKDVETTEQPSTSKGTTSNLSYELPSKIILSSSSESDTKYGEDSASDTESVKSNSETCIASKRLLEFSSSVEFYVDKTPNKVHLEWQTLPHLTRPLYKYHLRRLLDPQRPQTWATKRKRHQASKLLKAPPDAEPQLSETAKLNLMERIRELKVLTANEPEQLDNWLKLHQLLGQNVSKSNRLAVAEHQLHTLETALEHHPGNEQLLQHYVDTTSATYPDSQVATKIEQLLQRTPYEYTLWRALIMSTQGTMARCNIPDVLKIYEQCMRRMHLGPKAQRQQTDELMLKLFHNCVLFLRQSANFEKMYALLRLALELNFPFVEFDCFETRAVREEPLLDYEELVLKSGMPMTEIWTRVERLRQAYNFLPYPVQLDREPCLETEDPQRMVYSADVCHYIYPLKEQKNTMHLLLLTIQLTKMPLVRSSCLAERLAARISQIGDSDAIEMLLTPLGDRLSYALPPEQPDDVYWSAVMELCRELCVSPSFMPHTIGFDVHQRCIEELLDICGLCFVVKPEHETKRRICIMLWLRFRRLCLRLLQLSKKRIDGFVKDARKTHRRVLESGRNRNITRFYTEIAMFEYEAREDKQYAFKMLDKIIKDFQHTNAEHLHALLIYTEMLIGQKSAEQAMELLESTLPNIRQQLDETLVVKVEDTEDAMPLEDYFVPDRLIMLLRLHCLQLHLQHETLAARQLLEELLEKPRFALGHSFHLSTFRREQLRELQLLMMQLSEKPTKQMFGFLDHALQEFPRNLLLLQRCSMLGSLPWYKLRIRLMHTRGGIVAFLHLVLAARCRFQQQWLNEPMEEDLLTFSQSHLSQLLRNRLLNLFETLLPTNPRRTAVEAEQYAILRRNSLYWRLYLRCLSTTATSLERSKSCLLMALDECPWDKALYMDGVTYVPPELGNLQDVMMEKQVRIYAIPEELNVLRGA